VKKDIYAEVMSRITKIREQGEPPKSDLFSFDSFVCDLCKGVIVRSEILQCPFCGRWVCREKCWHQTVMACTSCSSVIKLCKESKKIALKEKINRKVKPKSLLKIIKKRKGRK